MLETFTCEQGSEEWLRLRMDVPTASMFGSVMAKGKGKARRTYMHKIAGQIITGQLVESFETKTTKRGHEMEIKALNLYRFQQEVEVDPIGFMLNGKKGASPDGGVGSDGLVEVKSKAPHILIDVLLSGEMPDEHKPQVQGQLLVAEREWCDFIAYYDRMPMLIKRIYRDDAYCRELNSAINVFNYELKELVEKLEQM